RPEHASAAIAEAFGVGVGVAQRIRDQHSRLARQLKTLPALIARHQVIQTHHIRSSLRESLSVFFSSAPRKLFPFSANLPAHWRFKFPPAAWTYKLDLAGF